jgi:hypothetical protein
MKTANQKVKIGASIFATLVMGISSTFPAVAGELSLRDSQGNLLATGKYNPGTDNIRVDDNASDGKRAYVEWEISTGRKGVCEDTGGASGPGVRCLYNFREGKTITWRLCVRDASGGGSPTCTPYKTEST